MSEIRIGGQAVIEGVVMRGETRVATAVRKPSGNIEVKVEEKLPFAKSHWVLGLPIIRGVATLAETIAIGIGALNYSANVSLEQEKEKLGGFEFGVTIVFSLALAIGLFIALPAFFFSLLKEYIRSTLLLNLAEGLIRISIFFVFLIIVSRFPDMKRVFEYHGAEHKVVHTYEELKRKDTENIKEELTPEKVRKHPTAHVSCGTSFVLLVLIVSIFVFSFFGRPGFFARIFLKLLALPLVAGIAYEIIKWARRPEAPKYIKALVAPGVWLQRFTTREPAPDQVEVAIKALKEAI